MTQPMMYDAEPQLPTTDGPTSAEVRALVDVACRAMLMFIGWANRKYKLGYKLRG